uniref:BPL/LPL catalytic domain-containing protein n=1 Tax=Vannella robusta TaxID=1487602 RepID=A0A7S4HNG7_9EUKA|mmetsp:Transcript_133/g.171  ORF Transcript_133/g.171 Transcript_133/m.171 type:complete len:244 (+) Transcript_133:66-797(+)
MSVKGFVVAEFQSLLRTKWLGRDVRYFPSIASTQDFLREQFREVPLGTVIVTDEQGSGKGRGGNSWTSPAGCLMFSFLTKVKEGTLLPFFQYLISLALVRAIKEYPHEESLQNLPIQIKWPNDIYSGNQKICGVLCNSEYFEKEFHIISGVGINVSNCEPTTCINQLLQNANIKNLEFSRETVLAEFCNSFESMFETFRIEGFAPFNDQYCEHWLHSNQKVVIMEAAHEVPVWILGLTKNGYA